MFFSWGKKEEKKYVTFLICIIIKIRIVHAFITYLSVLERFAAMTQPLLACKKEWNTHVIVLETIY